MGKCFNRNRLKDYLTDILLWSAFPPPPELLALGITKKRWYQLLDQSVKMYAWEERVIREFFNLDHDFLIPPIDEEKDRLVA